MTVDGRLFRVKVLWRTDDNMTASGFLSKSCVRWIKKWVGEHTPYRTYILAGHAIGEGSGIVLTSVDNCSGPAPKFQAPGQNVFK